ncbi:MAG TPA: alanine racemase [Holophaga sp.]|nr:alanine racemase [Holophaga sp.]
MRTGLPELPGPWAEVDLDAIVHNLGEARRIVPAGTRIAGVVKADAYGHGAVRVSQELLAHGIDLLAVARLSEALELRAHFPAAPILVMGHTPDAQLALGLEHGIDLTIFSFEQASLLSGLATGRSRPARVHLKLDTGLNRLGLKGPDTASTALRICRLDHLQVEGIYTHLALVDEAADMAQYGRFMAVVDRIEAGGVRIPLKHLSDSNGMVLYPALDLGMVRLGGFLFGVTTPGLFKGVIDLRPAMAFKTRITRIAGVEAGEQVGYEPAFVAPRPGRIGTLAVGYADGYARSLSGKGVVGVRGKRAPVVGIICMDQCMVDLTDIPEAKVGDEVLLFGPGPEDAIPVNDVARWIDTNRHELLSGLSRRVPRLYLKGSRMVGMTDELLETVGTPAGACR